jgi:hypothetical protein
MTGYLCVYTYIHTYIHTIHTYNTYIHIYAHTLDSRLQLEPDPVGLNVNDWLFTHTLLGSEPWVNDATATWLLQLPPSDPLLMLPEKVRVWNILARSLHMYV